MERPHAHPFSRILFEIEAKALTRDLTLRELIDLAGSKSDIFLSLLLILPFLQPVPLPGLSSLLGLSVAFFGICHALKRKIWMPVRFMKIRIPSATLVRICTVATRVFAGVEKLGVRARGRNLFQSRLANALLGTSIAVHSSILALPLPIPATNFVPAVVIFLTTLAALEEDAFVLALSCLAVVGNAVFFALLLIVPMKGIEWGWMNL